LVENIYMFYSWFYANDVVSSNTISLNLCITEERQKHAANNPENDPPQ